MKKKSNTLMTLLPILLVIIVVSYGMSHMEQSSNGTGGPVSDGETETHTVHISDSGTGNAPGSTEGYRVTEKTILQEKIPDYNGNPIEVISKNIPAFTQNDLTTSSYEKYSPLDELGRCGEATACIGKDLMPKEKRGSIGMVKPSGWHTIRYDDLVDGKYLYNRCHLIAFQLAGENANEKNLITGTRYLNVQGMLPYEEEVGDYVSETGNHVIYRVTPIFVEEDLVARGVQMEAYSVEDKGEGICYNVFCYNVQPGVEINYRTGESRRIQ